MAEYLQAGADIVFGKPLKMGWLTMLLNHVKAQGSLSQPGMTLVENGNKMEWVVKL